jgi:hypothetical protein
LKKAILISEEISGNGCFHKSGHQSKSEAKESPKQFQKQIFSFPSRFHFSLFQKASARPGSEQPSTSRQCGCWQKKRGKDILQTSTKFPEEKANEYVYGKVPDVYDTEADRIFCSSNS